MVGRGRGGIGWREAMGMPCPYGMRGLGVEDTGILTIEEEEPKKAMSLLLIGGAILAGMFFMRNK